jgi:hypothetical protein
MLWVGGGQGAGKTTLSWRLSRATDLPLHPWGVWLLPKPARTRPEPPSPDQAGTRHHLSHRPR